MAPLSKRALMRQPLGELFDAPKSKRHTILREDKDQGVLYMVQKAAVRPDV